MRTTRLPRRRVVWIVLLALVVLTSAIAYRLLSSRTAEPRAGDSQAAGFADSQLLGLLNEAADTSDDRILAVEDALRHPTGMLEDPYPFAFELTSVDGNSMAVATYYHFNDTSFSGAFPGGLYWGRACRTYVVQPSAVRSFATDCDATVATEPR
jgi:hypothetical protein